MILDEFYDFLIRNELRTQTMYLRFPYDKLSSGKHSYLVLVERHTGFEPASPVWKTGMLPLH